MGPSLCGIRVGTIYSGVNTVNYTVNTVNFKKGGEDFYSPRKKGGKTEQRLKKRGGGKDFLDQFSPNSGLSNR